MTDLTASRRALTLPPSLQELVWPKDAATAMAQQQELRSRVRIAVDYGQPRLVAGVDVSYDTASNISHAVVTVMTLDDLKPLTSVVRHAPTEFPYIPGLLSFREIPVILQALAALDIAPDLLMVDGQGIAHPRRLGIAAHLGVLLDMPAIGVAKSRLIGRFDEPGPARGASSPLFDKGERIGTVLRSKERTNALFVSPGHRVDQEGAVEIVLRCLTRYRLPEPTRIADKISKSLDVKSGGTGAGTLL